MSKKLTKDEKIFLYQKASQVSSSFRDFISLYLLLKTDKGHDRTFIMSLDRVYKRLEECSDLFDNTIDLI